MELSEKVYFTNKKILFSISSINNYDFEVGKMLIVKKTENLRILTINRNKKNIRQVFLCTFQRRVNFSNGKSL